jgi:hypothetical protein
VKNSGFKPQGFYKIFPKNIKYAPDNQPTINQTPLITTTLRKYKNIKEKNKLTKTKNAGNKRIIFSRYNHLPVISTNQPANSQM